jgi:hypothetical protein
MMQLLVNCSSHNLRKLISTLGTSPQARLTLIT